MERVSRIELPSLAWEANALTVVLYPQMTAGTVTLRLGPWDASFIKSFRRICQETSFNVLPIKLTRVASHSYGCRVRTYNSFFAERC